MSNLVIGPVYLQIIEKIIADSKEDFEAAGLDQDTLQELKQQWQQNISNLEIAHCPWDPPPPQTQISNPPTVPSNVKPEPHYKAEQFKNEPYKTEQFKTEPYKTEPYKTEQFKNEQFKAEPSGGNTQVTLPAQPVRSTNEHSIKQETKYEPNVPSYPPTSNYPQGQLNHHAAQQRANQLLHQQYGSQANASIQAAQQRGMQMPGQRPTHIQLPSQQRPPQPQYPQQPSSLGAAQTDGADDSMEQWSAMLVDRRVRTDEERLAADGMLRAHLEQSAAFMDSGLMVPLSDIAKKGKKRRIAKSAPLAGQSLAVPSSASGSVPQFDGGDDEDDKDEVKAKILDEDAINSDLDDSEDELENEAADESEGPMGETILCTYDKVQRVKNKWKCTLKDGILTTGKKEYVFHKAQGEFEW